ncbi:uncharacterized protein LOC128039704 isoform X2 [Gossypium raimondii]|uniref:uncharacterized protein LOC128039704 isoform X2 n=1 Tax=Gossypium raimondii TaxID=29730 RepID=UPI00227CFB12|nr:uncharacterized protein LOC128039704 isoform X2 [Gossypium raimondii]
MSWETNGLTSSKSVGKEIEDVGDSIRILASKLAGGILEAGHGMHSCEVHEECRQLMILTRSIHWSLWIWGMQCFTATEFPC